MGLAGEEITCSCPVLPHLYFCICICGNEIGGGRRNYLALCSYTLLRPLLTRPLARFPLYHTQIQMQIQKPSSPPLLTTALARLSLYQSLIERKSEWHCHVACDWNQAQILGSKTTTMTAGGKNMIPAPKIASPKKLELWIALKHISSENVPWIFPPSLGMTPRWLLSMERESESINVPWISPCFPRNDPSLASQHGIGAEMEQSIGPRSSHTQRERQRQNCKRQRQNWKRQRQKMGQSIEPTHHHHHHHHICLYWAINWARRCYSGRLWSAKDYQRCWEYVNRWNRKENTKIQI